MSVESDLRTAFLNNANVSSLISTRFYPGEVPQNAGLPAIAYLQVNDEGERTLGGVFVEQQANYSLRLVADSYDEIVQLKAACLELAGSSEGSITEIEISSGPDGYDFDTERYIKVMNVLCLT